MCGGLLEVKEGQTVVTCEFCGTAQTVPHFDNEKKATFFRRANDLRLKCEFDKASGVYETIVTEFPNEAEAYWGLVLCKYGIEYVDDPKTKKKIPTCHRTQFSSIFEDHDYLAAIRNADAVAREVYKREANAISKLQSAILEISSKEDPFDVFICYKETDERGGRTADSVLAQDIYDELTSAGYKVFFARRTLERRLGSEYEPYIFAALHSAKVMLHVTTNKVNSDSVWVKNEWARYLSLIAEGQKKVLIPCYKGINAYDLPEEMKNLQAQDMGKLGSMQDLIYGIKKIIKPAGRVTTTEVEKEESFVSDTGYDALIRKGHTYLKNHKMEQAKRCFEKAIEATELCGDAYLGILLCEYQLESLEELLAQSDLSILENENFKLAHEFANKSCNATLDKVEKAIINNEKKERYNQAKSSLEAGRFDAAIEEFKELGDFEDSPEQIKECIYQKGQMYFGYINNIKNLGYCDDAIACFEEVISYKDSKEMIDKTNSLRAKITEEYKTSCISKYFIALPKDVTLLTLAELVKSVKANKDRVFTPSFSEFDDARAEAEASVIKFFVEKCPTLIQSFKALDECSKLTGLCSCVEKDKNLKSVHELIKQREQEIKEQIKVLKKKRRKKSLIITAITSGVLAVAVASFFGVKAIVDENNRKATYASANTAMEAGNYDDAIAYYQSLGNYNESQKKIQVCNGLKQLEASIESKSEADAIQGIKTIVSAGEKVDVSYETENNVNVRRLAGGNSGNKTETIETVDFTLYQPSWSGYTFLNWNSDSLSYKNERTYLGMMSNWSLNSYTITYNLNGGTNSQNNPFTFTVETTDIVLQPATKTGYTFDGWFDNNNNRVEKINKGTFENIVLTANWVANDYTITLIPNGGSVSSTTINVKYDSQYTLPTPTRDYYGFTGWYDSNNTKWTDGKYTVAGNTTLTARWSANTYSITYVMNGGTNNSSNPSSYTVEDSVTLLNPSRTGYGFTGWYDESNNKVTGISVGSHGDRTFTAKWNINTYTVTFKNYDGTVLDTQTVDHGSTAIYGGATPTRPATAQYTYSWTGWDKSLSNITSNTTVTATYSSTVNKYTITWKNYDGSTLKTDSVAYGNTPSYSGTTPTKPSTDLETYSWSGWTPTVVSVTGNATYTATFTTNAIYSYSVSSSETTITGVSVTNLTRYTIPSSLGGYPVTRLGEGALANCSLAKEIIVPDSVKYIGAGAFNGCSSLATITLPFSGFYHFPISSNYNSHQNEWNYFGYVFGTTSYNNSTLIQHYSYSDGSINGYPHYVYYKYYIPNSLTTVNIIDSTNTEFAIGRYAFANNTILKNINIDAAVKIDEYSFSSCTSLENLTLSSRVLSIQGYAFKSCTSLSEIIMEDSETTIESYAFDSCSSLKKAILSKYSVPSRAIFSNCFSLEEVDLPKCGISSSTTAYETLFGEFFTPCSNSDVYGDNVIKVSISVTYNTSNTGTIYYAIPASLKKVTIRGTNIVGLRGMRMIEELHAPDATSIGANALRSCSSLVTIDAPKLSNIAGNEAFEYCYKLESINLSLVTTIPKYSFRNCEKLDYIILSNRLQAIGESAFAGCSSLTKVFYDGTEVEWTNTGVNSTGNAYIQSAIPYYYSSTEPVECGDYWHYVNGLPTIWSEKAIHYGDGTFSSPYTVESAAHAIGNLTSTYQYSSSEIYVSGVVTKVEYNSVSNDWKIYFDGSTLTDLLIVKNYIFDSNVFTSATINNYTGDNANNLVGKTIKVHGYGFKDYPSEQAMIVPNNNVKPTIYYLG